MSDAQSEPGHATPVASHVARWARVKEALGVRSQEQAADQIGVSLRTFQRFLANPDSTTVRHARLIAGATGISVEELSTEPELAEVA